MSELTQEERDEFAAVLAAANRPNLTNDAAIAAERASWLWVADALDGTLARIVADRTRAAVERAEVAAEQRGREDNADHDMCYVYGSRALEGRLAEAWDEGFREGQRRWATNYGINGKQAPNPYRDALSGAERRGDVEVGTGAPEASEGARGAVRGSGEGNEG